jgi:hypothetical protein
LQKLNSFFSLTFFFLIVFSLSFDALFVDSLFSEESFSRSSLQNSSEPKNPSEPYPQWFIGPVLIPNPKTPPPDHPAIAIAAGAQNIYGRYNSHWKAQDVPNFWAVGPYIALQAGFNSFLGMEFIGASSTNLSQGKHSTHPLDMILRLGFQVCTDKRGGLTPDFRIFLQEIFPTGKYQHLSLYKHGTDLTGQGSYRTGIQLASQKVFYLSEEHKLRIRLTMGYFVPAPVEVTGINYYGGAPSTQGRVHPGNFFVADSCGEYNLSRTWALALEAHYLQGAKGHFSKKSGPNIDLPSYAQILLTPEVQHTFSKNFGTILGSSFSIAGRNVSQFYSFFLIFAYRF